MTNTGDRGLGNAIIYYEVTGKKKGNNPALLTRWVTS